MDTKSKILIVDDDVDLAESLCEILKHNGYAADKANNLEDVLNKVNDIEYDLTFMDMQLPNTNGLQIFKKIKEIRPHAKVIIMTGNVLLLSGLYTSSLQEGMIDEFLRKPFPPDELISIVKKYTSNQ